MRVGGAPGFLLLVWGEFPRNRHAPWLDPTALKCKNVSGWLTSALGELGTGQGGVGGVAQANSGQADWGVEWLGRRNHVLNSGLCSCSGCAPVDGAAVQRFAPRLDAGCARCRGGGAGPAPAPAPAQRLPRSSPFRSRPFSRPWKPSRAAREQLECSPRPGPIRAASLSLSFCAGRPAGQQRPEWPQGLRDLGSGSSAVSAGTEGRADRGWAGTPQGQVTPVFWVTAGSYSATDPLTQKSAQLLVTPFSCPDQSGYCTQIL